VRDDYGAPHPALQGTRDRIELSRNGYANSLAAPRAELERVGYHVVERELRRQRYAMLDRTPSTPRSDDTLIGQVNGIEWRYLASDGREFTQWPPPRSVESHLPRAVIVTLSLDGYDDIRRVLEFPAEAAP
jgi:type II secretion system protein J